MTIQEVMEIIDVVPRGMAGDARRNDIRAALTALIAHGGAAVEARVAARAEAQA